jgi:hypothetical protein
MPTEGLCTAALPGAVFQEIYVCLRCCGGTHDDKDAAITAAAITAAAITDAAITDAAITDVAIHPACLCQACAEACHGDCRLEDGESAVEYRGLGPASCDCHALATNDDTTTPSCVCRLHEESTAWAVAQATLLPSWDAQWTWPRTMAASPVQVHCLAGLDRPRAHVLVEQAQLLVQHSKETFWIDESTCRRPAGALSLLEDVAWQLLQEHGRAQGVPLRGAEWWVQVKQQQSEDEDDATSNNIAATPSIDLHYDKDEVLAAAYGVGVFPTWSTVTYLTDASTTTTTTTTGATPTLIFPRTYHEAADERLPHVWKSRPIVGKHLVFDGALLHGAVPLVQGPDALSSSPNDNADNGLRVTFLVNLWESHRPLGVAPLPANIRQALQQAIGPEDSRALRPKVALTSPPVTQFPSVSAVSTDWMSLPFVEDGMVVQTVRLTTECPADTILIQYHLDQQAYLEYPGEYGEEDEAGDEAIREKDE